MKTSTARRISELLDNDGQCWETTDGRSLDALCREERVTVAYRGGDPGSDTYRYDFADGSVITVAGGGWDLGYPDCYCWQGAGVDAGHTNAECPLSPDYESETA